MTRSIASPAKRVSALLLLLLYAALIYRGSDTAAPEAIISLGLPDLLLHLGEFAVFGLFTARWVGLETGRTGLLALVLVPGIIATAWGAGDELHQAFVPERFPALSDLLADGVGGLLGAAVYRAALLGRIRRGPDRADA